MAGTDTDRKTVNGTPVHILDCTLRDGSYAIDYQFTAKDTWLISSALEQAGIKYIEIGHGLGLGASREGHGVALEKDEAYCEAIAGKLNQAKWGAFFIPGIGTLADLDRLADFGADFIRIGTDVNRVAHSEPFIRRAKERGLQVFSNFMKTYSVSPEEFVRYALVAEAMGSDILVVVDSAGGMLPDDVTRYTAQLREKSQLPIGFHGHNNLDLAIANSVAAVQAGATFIDCSLQGMGRSAGNAITEVFALVLEKMGYSTGYNAHKLMDIGEKFIKPLLREDKFTGISMTSGFAQFHSSFLDIILEYAGRYKIDPRELIIQVCRENQTHAPEELVNDMAVRIAQEKNGVSSYRIEIRDHYPGRLEEIVKEAASLASKQHKTLVYNLVQSEQTVPLSRNVQQDNQFILLNGQGPSLECFHDVLKVLESFSCPLLLIDRHFEQASSVENAILYDDMAIWTDALLCDLNEGMAGKCVYFVGEHPVRAALEAMSAQFQFCQVLQPEGAEVLVSFDAVAASKMVELSGFSLFYDAVIGGFKGSLDRFEDRLVYRVNMAPALFAFLKKTQAYRGLAKRRGKRSVGAITLVSGGVLGRKGDIVVDDYLTPKMIIGIADGSGGLEQELAPYQHQLNEMQSYIAGLGL